MKKGTERCGYETHGKNGMRKKLKNSRAALRVRLENRIAAGEDLPKPETLPVLIPQKALDALDTEGAYEFTEAIRVPAEGTGGVYTADYFRSLLDYLKKYPIPGDKLGHGDKPRDDFFTVGGELRMENGEEGVCYLRVMVPQKGWDTPNDGFIRSLRAGIPELSIVADVEGERGNDGRVYYRKELGRPRNDKVDEGAMEIAISNSRQAAAPNETEILALVENGAIDTESESEDLITNGKVCRKAALRMQFNGPDRALGARVMDAIANRMRSAAGGESPGRGSHQQPQGRKHSMSTKNEGMTVEEIIAAAKTAILNNQLTLEQLSKELQMENKLRNATDEQREKFMKFVIEEMELPADATVDDVKKAVQDLLREVEESSDAVAETEVNRLAGGRRRLNSMGVEEVNEAYEYAMKQLRGLTGKRLNRKLEELKTDRIFNRLISQQADPGSRANSFPGFGGVPGLRKV